MVDMATESESGSSAPAASRPQQKAVVVVGPGRSGTSALTRAVAALGVDLGSNLKRGSSKNPKGFFEDLEILDLNYELHEAFGLRRNGSSVRLLSDEDWARVDLDPFRERLDKIIRERFSDAACWGFKCGGVIRMLPFWEEALEALHQQVYYVMAIRNPVDVSASRRKLDALRGVREKCDVEWLTQVVPYYRRLFERRCVVVDYDRLLDDPQRELRRMARVLEIEVTDKVESGIRQYAEEFLNPDLRHSATGFDAFADDPRTNPVTREGYRWLLRFASDEVEPGNAAHEKWQREWPSIEASLETMRPLLRHIDSLEDDLRTRGWGLFSFLRARLWRGRGATTSAG
jgi:hypothetical protein